jgi:hypothetical protein
MLEQLKKDVCKANLDLVAEGLVIQTWGNVSGIDRERGLVAIKPSGVPYDGMKPERQVVVSLETGAGFAPTSAQWPCQWVPSPALSGPCQSSRKPRTTGPRESSVASKVRADWTTPSFGNMRCFSRCRPTNDAA